MKTWNETVDVLSGARACLDAGQSCAVVVLTRVEGSAFRRPGAKLLVRADGSMSGNVSGGCLENDLRERAVKSIRTGAPALVHYSTGTDEDRIWGLGLGCDGELDLLIVPVKTPSAWINEVLAPMKQSAPVTIAWPLSDRPDASPRLVIDAGIAEDVFLDRLQPPPDLVVIGAGDDAIPLVRLAAETGFRVTVCDHRPDYLSPDRFPLATGIQHLRPVSAAGILPAHPRTMVVIKNHALQMDKAWAAFYDRTDVAYIGLLGPQKRCAHLRETMTSGNTGRIYGPAGLDLGSEGAEQIAASIVAELLAIVAGRNPVHLRERKDPIHSR